MTPVNILITGQVDHGKSTLIVRQIENKAFEKVQAAMMKARKALPAA